MFCKSNYEYICKWLIYYCFKSLRPFIIRKRNEYSIITNVQDINVSTNIYGIRLCTIDKN